MPPMIIPCRTNMRWICARRAPIDIRIATSRCFSITSITKHNQNVERGDELNQPDGDDADHLFEPKRVQQRAVLIHPCAGDEIRSYDAFGFACHGRGLKYVVEAQFNRVHNVVEVEHVLRGIERSKRPAGIEAVEAGLKDPGDAKVVKAGNDAHRRQFALIADDGDRVVHGNAELLRQIGTEHCLIVKSGLIKCPRAILF